MLLTAFAGAYGTQSLFSSESAIDDSHHLNLGLERLLSLLRDAETGQRGFVITGRESYLEPYFDATPKISAQLDAIKLLVQNDNRQRQRLGDLRFTVDEKLAEVGRVIMARRTGGFDAAKAMVQSDKGKLLMDRARLVVADMEKTADDELTVRRGRARHTRDFAIVVAIVSAALTVLMAVSFAYWLRRLTRVRIRVIGQLHDRKQLLRVTLASIGDGVVTTDVSGRVTFMNAVARSLAGWESANATGLPIEDVLVLVNETSRATVANPTRTALAERRSVALANHTMLITRAGVEVHIDDSAAPILDIAGNLVGSVLVFRDVGLRKQYEDELRESDRRKSEFLAVMSHELRNPIAAIRSALEVLNRVDNDPRHLERLLALMDRQVLHMTRLIDDLLDVARVSKGALDLKMERVDIHALIASSVETAQAVLDKRRNALAVKLPPEPISVQGDAARLCQAVANILTNASKYSDMGSPITLAVSVVHGEVLITVCDKGIGFSPEDAERIFDMFAQVDRSSDLSKEGLGIGLSLARQIALLHGGRIVANSAGRGLGSEFTIHLPEDKTGPISVQMPPQTEFTPGREQGLRVLVADDNEDAADALATLLRLSGFDVTVAHDGEQAARFSSDMHPDIVLLDIGMPKLTGYEVAKRIRSETWAVRPILIAITGWGQPEDRRQTHEVGFDVHFTKPIDFVRLHHAIVDSISRVRGHPT
ncbi:Sensor histidine kinase RcsC (plasmid) [Caballeronia sp. SBC1]|uniref:hybrid sensor histidine kinase/response regulator n=1 Tax=Caballeronia sp. SBC1 TaxID=2705548 RepID=UPI00140F043C|nr:CHASE3 domain-containing protein [Caballeronia sp. SBC1]QIN67913.1 Sensor histidine kinase RcsC [Caballeronia sp. SBC1]